MSTDLLATSYSLYLVLGTQITIKIEIKSFTYSPIFQGTIIDSFTANNIVGVNGEPSQKEDANPWWKISTSNFPNSHRNLDQG